MHTNPRRFAAAALSTILLLAAGCAAPAQPAVTVPDDGPDTEVDAALDRIQRLPTREEWQERIARALNEGQGTREQALYDLAGRSFRDDEAPWLSADLDGDGEAEYVLAGTSRRNTYLPVTQRIDRYRYVEGEFRLVDRRFAERQENGYARLWDGLVAEDVDRVDDALAAYRQAMEPTLPAHAGSILRYGAPPRELTAEEMDRFGEALRTFARFRVGALLLAEGREEEARAALDPGGRGGEPAVPAAYAGLLEATAGAADRPGVGRAVAAWAAANPAFLQALNLGVGTEPWTPEILCGHIDIDDRGPWETEG